MDDAYDLALKVNQQATNDTLAEFCIYLADAAGVEEIEGIPPGEWFVKRKKENLDKALMKLEDLDPAAAAKLQKLIDDSRNKKPH